MSEPRAASTQITAADEADAGDDLGQYPGGIHPFPAKGRAQSHKQLGAETDQNAGPDAGGLPPQLPLETNDAAAENRGAQPGV